MRRTLTGLGATLLLLLLLVGLPALLVLIWPVGLPHIQLTPAGVWAALLRPDDGTLFLTLIKAAGWVVWALMLLTVTTEAIGRLRHLTPVSLPGLALPQGVARGLVAATIALFINTNTAISSPPPATTAHAAPLVPAPAATPDEPVELHVDRAAARYERYTVKKGDILSQIALDHLGDAHRYPEIYKASRSIDQPGGRRLTDPDVIDIGWKLNLPTEHPASPKTDKPPAKTPSPPRPDADPPATTTAQTGTNGPAPQTPVGPATPAGPATPSSSQPSTPSAAAVPAAEVESESAQPPWLLTGLAGAGAILAAAVWLVVLRRRAVQHHHRRPGFITPPPPPHTIPVEKTLRNQGGPAGGLLTFLDESLRRLALTLGANKQPLPVLLAAAATTSGIRLHFATPATLPEPWQQAADDPAVWSLDMGDLPHDLAPLEPDGPAPWPHLATVGADDTGRWWLVNLETAGITTIGGDPDYADDLARYLAAELATTPWSRDVRVDLIDTFPELADLDPGRLRHHADADGADDAIAVAVETVDRLTLLDVDDLPAARAARAGDELWFNHVVFTTSQAGHLAALTRLIHDQPGRTAVAVVLTGTAQTTAPGGLAITVGADGRARIPALGLDLVANGITADEAGGCVQLIQAAEHLDNTDLPRAGTDGWRRNSDQAGRLNPELTEPRNPDGTDDPDESNLPQPDADILGNTATTSDDLAVLAPTVPEPSRSRVLDDDPGLDQDLADWFSDDCVRPRLSVLGPMRVRVGPTGRPGDAAKRKPYYTELVAYLATRPTGATTAQLCATFSATPARLQRDLAVVRAWLGTDPATGERRLPEVVRSSLVNNGRGVYQLHDVLCDADLFKRLRLRGQTRGPDGLDDYMRALSLVTGPPYTHMHPGGGSWLSDDRHDQYLLVAIVDTAHLAVTMALQNKDLKLARLAAEVAAAAAPNEQTPKLDLVEVAKAEGDTGRAARELNDLLQQRDADGPIEPDPRTTELVETRGWTKSPASP